jgi:hypothetical protein
MIVADLLRGLTLISLFLVRSADFLWLVYVVACIESSISVFFGPARAVLLRDVVSDESLVPANALISISDNACRLIGPVMGGALFLLLGLNMLVLLDVVSYIISAFLVTRIIIMISRAGENPPDEQSTEGAAKIQNSQLTFWQQWLQGLELLRRERWLGILCLCMVAAMLGQGAFNSLLAIFGAQVVKMNSETYGWYLSAQGIGGLAGGFIVGKVGKMFRPSHLLALSLGGTSLLLLLQFNLPLIPIALGTSVLVGIFVVGMIVSLQTLLQLGVDPAYLGRITSTYGTAQMAALLIGTTGASLLGQIWGIVPTLNLAAALLLLASVGSLLWLRKVTGWKAQRYGTEETIRA